MGLAHFLCVPGITFKPLVEAIKASWPNLQLAIEDSGGLSVYKDDVGKQAGDNAAHITVTIESTTVHLAFDDSLETKSIVGQLKQQFDTGVGP